MIHQEALNALSNAEAQLRSICHSEYHSVPPVNDRVQLAITLLRDAWILINEGPAAQVLDIQRQVQIYLDFQKALTRTRGIQDGARTPSPTEHTTQELLAACKFSAQKFREYEQLHQAKGTPEGNQKAQANASYAAKIEAVITKAANSQPSTLNS